MQIMNPVTSYPAEKVIDDIRKGRKISPLLAAELKTPPEVDEIRKLVEPEDVPFVLKLVDSGERECVLLGIGLLKLHVGDKRVRACIQKHWEESDDFLVKCDAMMRLLDCPGVDGAEMYKFVNDNWEEWLAETNAWYKKHSGSDGILSSMKKRLEDPSFRNEKAWVYLCGAMCDYGENKEAVKDLIGQYVNSRYPLTARVASALLGKIS